MNPLVVSFHTEGHYSDVAAARLLPSLAALGLESDVRRVPEFATWTEAGQYKPRFLSEMRKAHPNQDLLWVDVDAVIRSDPFAYLEPLECDIGIHFLGSELLSGTIWFPSRGRVDEILSAWQAANSPGDWDQRTLQRAIGDRFQIARLPAEYCCIFDTMRQQHRGIAPVIEHFQASRELRKRGVIPWGRPK